MLKERMAPDDETIPSRSPGHSLAESVAPAA